MEKFIFCAVFEVMSNWVLEQKLLSQKRKEKTLLPIRKLRNLKEKDRDL